MRFGACAALLLLAACKSGDGAIVVTVAADPSLTSVARLSATVTGAGRTRTFDVTPLPATTIPPQPTFAITASAHVGALHIHLDAFNASATWIASGDGSATPVAGGRTAVTIALSRPLRGSFVAGAASSAAGAVRLRGTFQWQGGAPATASKGNVTLTGHLQ